MRARTETCNFSATLNLSYEILINGDSDGLERFVSLKKKRYLVCYERKMVLCCVKRRKTVKISLNKINETSIWQFVFKSFIENDQI